jgi:hypothetical protein
MLPSAISCSAAAPAAAGAAWPAGLWGVWAVEGRGSAMEESVLLLNVELDDVVEYERGRAISRGAPSVLQATLVSARVGRGRLICF